MQRWTALVFLGLVIVAAALVVAARQAPSFGAASVQAESASAAAPAAPAPNNGAPVLLVGANTSLPAPTLANPPDMDAGAMPVFTDDMGENADAGTTLANGEPVPSLDVNAPKTVTFGIILVFYRGAQGAPRDARPREDALALAQTIAEEAKTDFVAAGRKGDVGMENAGSVTRGVLEPSPEYTLFSLAVGDVSAPVDSPRGYYVFKRIE